MDNLSTEFKSKAVTLIETITKKLEAYKGELPINIGLIQVGKIMYIDPLDGHSLIKVFINDSYHFWNNIRERDESKIIAELQSEVTDRAPKMTDLLTKVIDFALKNRQEVLGDYEEELWNEVGNLVKICIKYVHLKRERRLSPSGVMMYTQRYAHEIPLKKGVDDFKGIMSVKKEAEKWDIDLSLIEDKSNETPEEIYESAKSAFEVADTIFDAAKDAYATAVKIFEDATEAYESI